LYLEKLNRILNELSRNEEFSKKEDYLFLLNSLIDFILENKELKDLDFILKQKIRKIESIEMNKLEEKIIKLLKEINKQFFKEISSIRTNLDKLIKNQRNINEAKVLISKKGKNKKIIYLIEKIERINKVKGERIIKKYVRLINEFEKRKKDLENKFLLYKMDQKKDIYTLKLFLYQIYFDLKLIDEIIKEKKFEINKEIEDINKEFAYFERIFEKELKKEMEKEELFYE